MCTQKFIQIFSGVNYCSTWTKNGTLINFSKHPNNKFHKNLSRGLRSYMQTHTDKQAYWSSETYCYKISLQICQRNYWSFLGNVTRHYFQWWNSWSLCQTSLMNVAEKTIHNLCNIKVKQESEPIMWDITYINIFTNEPIRTMA